jgi:acyl-CoA reductase-like NAD-dependent aldehyde dehydrogenase
MAGLPKERLESIAKEISRETGKALEDSRAELVRSLETITLSAEEVVRIEGEHVPLDATAMGAGKIAMLLRFPVGVVAGITPFNAPFNLAAQKVAPALASGNVIVLNLETTFQSSRQSPTMLASLMRI